MANPNLNAHLDEPLSTIGGDMSVTPAVTRQAVAPQSNNNIDVPQTQDDMHSIEKRQHHDSQDIEYLYLDFNTELPTPVGISDANLEGATSLPPCPNLAKYTSPFLWSSTHKWITTLMACGVTIMAAYSAGEYTPASAQLLSAWNISEVAFNTGVTTFTTGFAIAPMVLAPFSELNGRR